MNDKMKSNEGTVIKSNGTSMTWTTLSLAPGQVSMDGHEYRLETSVWRDFMPISEESGRPMIAILKIRTLNSSQFPPDVKADLAWIIFGNGEQSQIWETHIVEEQPRDPNVNRNYIRVMARNGPKWGPHVNIDVVVQLRNSKEHAVLLQAKHQTIHRTD